MESKENDTRFVIPLLFAVTPIHSYLKEIKCCFVYFCYECSQVNGSVQSSGIVTAFPLHFSDNQAALCPVLFIITKHPVWKPYTFFLRNNPLLKVKIWGLIQLLTYSLKYSILNAAEKNPMNTRACLYLTRVWPMLFAFGSCFRKRKWTQRSPRNRLHFKLCNNQFTSPTDPVLTWF